MKVLVFERYEIISKRLVELILENFSDAIVFNVVSEEEFKAVVSNRKPDVVLLDMNRPGTPLPELITTLKKSSASMLIILLYTYTEELLVFQSMQAGADYVLCKYDQLDELISILNKHKTGPGINVKIKN
jgi:DNA-binding NarL/FixJ family response regulator